ncbi:Putative beta-lactamase-inhibitor-like, PepSY-like [Dyadobacter koreensis]|uniref:Putative beta-lactamase-inhibitor-like, PepSY-like n=1 Tax=Dyadobacter koreensis TaxID=408657 RepID=A0A1H6T3H8_9BACT|nr:PepSY-like domain-containing protein [Dyadobacter koreensis]SEI74689.1 Putative beta-lactamase-inhibitor-like, PepSY-like [Dyadobacter koreensis]
MKNLLTLALIVFVFCMSCDNDKDEIVDETRLPTVAQEFVQTHFPAAKVNQVVRDKDNNEVDYDVTLDNGTRLAFDKDGNVEDIESRTKLPDSVIPAKVLEYVTENYPDHQIIEWEKDRTDQEVKLSNNLELKFDLSGTFLRIDK